MESHHIKTEIEEVEQSDFNELENAFDFGNLLAPTSTSSEAPESEPESHRSFCLICLNVRSAFSELQFGNTGDGSKTTDDVALLGKQLFSIFILRELLHFPKSECVNLLQKTYGVDPGSWCSLCEACSSVVQKAFHAHQQILKLTRKLDKCRQRLKTSLEKSLGLEKDVIRQDVPILDFHDLIRSYFRGSRVDGGQEEDEVFLNEDFGDDDVPSPRTNAETSLENIPTFLPVTAEDNQSDLRGTLEPKNPNIESGTKLGVKLYHNDYLYRKDKDICSKGKVKVYWKCLQKGCKARLVEFNETFGEAKNPHTCTATAIENQLRFKKYEAKFYDYKNFIHPQGGSLMQNDDDFIDNVSLQPPPRDINETPIVPGAALDTLLSPDHPPPYEFKALQVSANHGDTEMRKLGCKLLYYDYLYRKDSGRENKSYWKCQAQGCKGRLVEADGNFTVTNYPHTCFTTAIENELKFTQYEWKYHNVKKKKPSRKVANESMTVTEHEKEEFTDYVPDPGPKIHEMLVDDDYEALVDRPSGSSSSGNDERSIKVKLEVKDIPGESDDEDKDMKKIGCRLYYDGYLYRKDKDHEDKIYWRCQSPQGCKGRLVEICGRFKRKYFHNCTATAIENQLEFSKYELKYKKTKKDSGMESESMNQSASLESPLNPHRKFRRPTSFQRSELDASFASYFESDDDDRRDAEDRDPIYDKHGPDSPAWSPGQKLLPKKLKQRKRKPGRPPGHPIKKLKSVDSTKIKETKTYRSRYVKKILGVAKRQQPRTNVEKIRPLEKRLKHFSWVKDPATNTKTFTCNRCGTTKPSYESSRRHTLNHKIDDTLESAGSITCDSGSVIPKFRCKICGETGRKWEISKHAINLHLRKQPRTEGPQGRSLGGNRRLASKVFNCDKCDFASQLYSSYLYHQNKHKMSESIEECGKADNGQPLFRCKLCGETRTKTVLSKHVFDKHLRKLPKEPGKEEPRTFTCSKCFRTFSKQASFSYHMRMHKIYDHIDYSGGESENGGKARCKLCNEVGDKLKVVAHIKQKHSLELELPIYQCHSCDKIFSENGPLKRHILSVHENVKKHLCSTCGKGFRYPHERSIHERKHLQVEKAVFVCEICGMKCSYKTTLRRHMKRFH